MASGSRSPTPLHPPPASLLFLFLLLLLLPVFPTPSHGNYSCPISSSCGTLANIPYPFWLASDPNDTDSHCGFPHFMLLCQNNTYPILRLADNSYRVTEIDHDKYTITLVDADILSPGITCPRVQHNLTLLSDSALTYPPSLDARLFFFFNCTDGPQSNTIFCLGSGRSRSYVFTEDDVPWEYDFSSICGDIVVAPVLLTDLPHLYDPVNQTYGIALSNGFKLSWSEATTGNCADCERSLGRCGFNRTGSNTSVFTCFCSDGVTQVNKCGQKKNFKLIIGIAVGVSAAIVAFLLCASILFCIYKRKLKYATSNTLIRKASSKPSSKDPEKCSVHFQTQLFSYNELHEATNGFDTSNELGDGGFGTVYKGTLSDGRNVAIKRLFHNNRQIEQFMNEIEILSRLHHQNLVDLYGCTSCESKELLLVYEFVPNGTVADHIHGSRASEGILKWPLRLNIAIETADALAYLHAIDPPIVHRDVKTSNILLDRSYHVKVADFGLSRLFPTDVTHVSTAPQGTPGYLDPEYHQCYQLTNKSDVYSFGVVLIELVSSKPAVDITRPRKEINLANMAINRIQTGQLDQLLDESLGYQSDQATRKMIAMVAEVAFRCLQADGDMRPSIKEVLESLQTIQSEGCRVLKKGKKAAEIGDDGLLKTVGPFSPDTVMNQWVSSSTTPNTSV